MVDFPVTSAKNGNRLIKLDEWMVLVLKDYYVNVNAKTGYIQCTPKSKPNAVPITLQQLILPTFKGRVADHVNGEKDDYTLANLQNITQRENCEKQKKSVSYRGNPTTSEFKGVSWNKKLQKWYSSIRVNGVLLNLGNYENVLVAAEVYNYFAKRLFTQPGNLNAVQTKESEMTVVNFVNLCVRVIKNLTKHGRFNDASKLAELV